MILESDEESYEIHARMNIKLKATLIKSQMTQGLWRRRKIRI